MKNHFKKIQFFSLACVLMGSVAAFSVSAKSTVARSGVLWGRQEDGTWVNIQNNPGISCTADNAVCKATFPAGQDPNVDATGATVIQANGYIN